MIDGSAVNARVRAFHEENGGTYLQIDGMCVYANGAIRDVDPMGVLADPPRDPYERAKIVLKYHAERHRRAVTKFRETRQRFLEHARDAKNGLCPAPAEDAETIRTILYGLQKLANNRADDLRAAKEALDRVTPTWAKANPSGAARQVESMTEILSTVSKIQI